MDWKEKIARIECRGLHQRRAVELDDPPVLADPPGLVDHPELGGLPRLHGPQGLGDPPASKIAVVEAARWGAETVYRQGERAWSQR
jgi:hypothetical protein